VINFDIYFNVVLQNVTHNFAISLAITVVMMIKYMLG
jgi:hypothetical protein